MKKYVHQIYYNDETRNQLLDGFIPLDNTQNPRPDWFEFWVILNFLRNNILEDDAWYGFLSPKFHEKTGYTAEYVNSLLDGQEDTGSVVLLSPAWDQLSFFLNPFEQGEMCHPGLLGLCQKFIDSTWMELDLSNLVTDTTSSVFSNYVIAKKDFWEEWEILAEEFFRCVENEPDYQSHTTYNSGENCFPMKTFIQERLATVILASGQFKAVCPPQSFTHPISTRLFPDDIETRILLQTCDLMKRRYRLSADEKYLEMYWKMRGNITFTRLSF
jgi:hypothetical protein